MITLEDKIKAILTVSALSEANDWAKSWYKEADMSAILAIGYSENLFDNFTEKGIAVIDGGFSLAHESLEKTPEELLELLEIS